MGASWVPNRRSVNTQWLLLLPRALAFVPHACTRVCFKVMKTARNKEWDPRDLTSHFSVAHHGL